MPKLNLPAGNTNTFQGFEPLDANFIFCPNQFFDLVIPNHSRPVVRLVAYILYETLRWLDEDGHPVKQDIAISFNDLVEKAGIGRGSIRKAIAEAENGGLIRCVAKGRSKSQGYPGRVGEYSLAWDESGAYAKTPGEFNGFYVGQGNRSPIPHSFFTRVIPNETLAVTKVVATVLRHTVGYQNQYGGGRRLEAHLSFKKIHRYARIASPNVVSTSIRQAISANYIRRVQPGRFSPESGDQTAAVYAVNWLSQTNSQQNGSKTVAVDRFKMSSRLSVQKPKQGEFNTDSRHGPKTVAAKRSKNRSTINNNQKDNSKQHRTSAAQLQESIEILRSAGFDDRAALAIAQQNEFSQIDNQIKWIKFRNSSKNQLGLLRTAINEKWPEPTAAIKKREADEHALREHRRDHSKREDERVSDERKMQWVQRWHAAPRSVRQKCRDVALQNESNPIVRNHLERKSIDDNPHANFLIVFKSSTGSGGVGDLTKRTSLPNAA